MFCVSFSLALLLLSPNVISQSLDSADLPAVWLRADKGTVTPFLWSDFTGHQRNATAVYGEGPVKNALFNYNPALSFDGINDYMNVAFGMEDLPELTVMAVFQSTDTTESGIWGAENAASREMLFTTRRAAGPDSTTDMIGKNEKFAVLSTVVQNWMPPFVTTQDASMALGSAGRQKAYRPFKGILAELLVFDKRLDQLTRLKYETYLAIKYGIPLSGSNYVSAGEKVLWPAEENDRYRYRITGLGKSDAFLLEQKQSRNAFDKDSLLTASIGNLATTNAENTSSLSNGDYFIWGDNDSSLTTSPNADGALEIVNRRWMMNVTGITAPNAKTKIRLRLNQLPPDLKGYWLVIDRSGQNDFSTDHLSYIAADSAGTDSSVFYSNVSWDADRSGKDMFGFARAKDLLAVMNLLDTPTCSRPTAGKVSIKLIGGTAPYQYELQNTATARTQKGMFAQGNGSLVLSDLSMGKYALKLTDAAGHLCERAWELTIPGALPVNLGPDRELAGNDIELDAGKDIHTNERVRYHWYSNNGFNSSESRIHVKKQGFYHVDITNEEGCVFSDEIAIREAGKQVFDVFPSLPSDGNFNISVLLPQKGNVSVFIYDLTGNKYDEMHGAGNARYRFSRHIGMPGMYMVVLKSAQGTESRKVIIQ